MLKYCNTVAMSAQNMTFEILGIQISFEGFFGDSSFVNPSKLICAPNIFQIWSKLKNA